MDPPGTRASLPMLTHRQLTVVPGAKIRFTQGDVTEVRRQMTAAAEGRNLWVARRNGDLAVVRYSVVRPGETTDSQLDWLRARNFDSSALIPAS